MSGFWQSAIVALPMIIIGTCLRVSGHVVGQDVWYAACIAVLASAVVRRTWE